MLVSIIIIKLLLSI